MDKLWLRRSWIRLSCLFATAWLVALAAAAGQEQQRKSVIRVLNADTTRVLQGEQRREVLTGNVILRQDSTIFYTDSATLTPDILHARGDVVVQHGDSVNAFANLLDYFRATKVAELTGDVVLENGGRKIFTDFLIYRMDTSLALYPQGALLTDGENFLQSRRGYYNTRTGVAIFRDSVVVGGPDFLLRSDSLIYDSRSDRVHFVAPTRMRYGDTRIYCEGGYYNLATGKGLFVQNAQYVSDEKVATADSMLFDNQTEEIELIGNAFYRELDRRVIAERILYNDRTKDATFSGNAVFRDSVRYATSDRIFYNTETGELETLGRSMIREGSRTVWADRIVRTGDGNKSNLSGSVVLRDTVSDLSVFCSDAISDDSAQVVRAFGDSTFLVVMIDEDSLFMSADTLVSYEDSSGRNQIMGYRRVRIYSTDMQARCDSVRYAESDSLFRLFGDPVIWTDTSQFTAETIHMQLANRNLDRIRLIRDAMILNSPDLLFFNQIRGKEILAYFRQGDLIRMDVDGNAQSIYYVRDDLQAYIGANEVECSRIRFSFGNNQVTGIRLYDRPSGLFHPMQRTNHQSLRLEGFRWREDGRPMDRNDIFTEKMVVE